MPKYWMISIRDDGGTGDDRNKNGATFWISDSPNDKNQLRNIKNWQKSTLSQFRKALIDACADFPDDGDGHDQDRQAPQLGRIDQGDVGIEPDVGEENW